MGYMKDPDRYTRGPGAIAAIDGKRRFRRRVARSAASERRDRFLAGITYGAQGGLSGYDSFGAIKDVEDPRDPVPDSGGSGKTPTTSTRPPVFRPTYHPTTISRPPRVPPGGSPYPPPPRGVIVDPAPKAPITGTSSGTVTAGSSSYGGGGGGGGGGGTTYPPAGPDTYPVEPPDTGPGELEIPKSTAPAVNLKTLAILGGAAAGIYLLFFHKKPSAT